MIKLSNLLEINNIVYSDKIKPKHQKKIDMKTSLFFEVKIPEFLFPENSSRETRMELQWLKSYNNNTINKDFVKKGDDIQEVFKKYMKENNLTYDKKYISKILKESSKFILKLKYYYNRPRPHQLAEYYGMKEFEDFELSSMKTPSYPSGHSTQGHLISLILSKKYPLHYDNFRKLANMISESRLMARAHYPSDCKFGEKVAMYIVGGLNQYKQGE